MFLAQDSSSGTVTIHQENGSQATFALSGGTYTPTAPRTIASLVQNQDGTYTFKRDARQTFTFSAAGQLTEWKCAKCQSWNGVANDYGGRTNCWSCLHAVTAHAERRDQWTWILLKVLVLALSLPHGDPPSHSS
jgi:hypothetical protein